MARLVLTDASQLIGLARVDGLGWLESARAANPSCWRKAAGIAAASALQRQSGGTLCANALCKKVVRLKQGDLCPSSCCRQRMRDTEHRKALCIRAARVRRTPTAGTGA
jgi:hypothetical protein